MIFAGCTGSSEKTYGSAAPGELILFGASSGSEASVSTSNAAETRAHELGDSLNISFSGDDADETFYFEWDDFAGDGISYSETKSVAFSCGGDYTNVIGSVNEDCMETRTSYPDMPSAASNFQRIDWKTGDRVKIYGSNISQAGTDPQSAVYMITSVDNASPAAKYSIASIALDNQVNPNGLRWGVGNADFFAIYPGNKSRTTAVNSATDFRMIENLPGNQGYTAETSGMGLRRSVICRPDMDNAPMMAVSRGVAPTTGPISLKFLPMMTTFTIELVNPLNSDLLIKKIALVSSHSALGGKYTVLYEKGAGSGTFSYSQVDVPVSEMSGSLKEVSLDLTSLSGGGATLVRQSKNYLKATLFIVPVAHDDLSLKVILGDGTERTLFLANKSSDPHSFGTPINFAPYKKYNIKVGIGDKVEYVMEVEPEHIILNNSSLHFFITDSYKKINGIRHGRQAWNIIGYSDTGADGTFTQPKPDWIKEMPDWNQHVFDPGLTPPKRRYEFRLVAYKDLPKKTTLNEENRTLRSREEVGTKSDPIDLSKVAFPYLIPDGATAAGYSSVPSNTANCYVVTRPGWYEFPMVYGNAIKNGIPNPQAYSTSVAGVGEAKVLQQFIRHDGSPVIAPKISDNGLTVVSAVLMYQTRKNLIDGIEVVGDKIRFHIDKDNIVEGNAVIAAKGLGGDVLWSWHIWIKGKKLDTVPIQSNWVLAGSPAGGHEWYDFLNDVIGISSLDNIHKFKFDTWVLFACGKATKKVHLEYQETTQLGTYFPGGFSSSRFDYVIYQWGRKDPFIRYNSDAELGNWYDSQGEYHTVYEYLRDDWGGGTATLAGKEIASTIKNPTTWNNQVDMDKYYSNLWDAAYNYNRGPLLANYKFDNVKTIYDPSPAGFVVPSEGAFSGMTKTGFTSGDPNTNNLGNPPRNLDFNSRYDFFIRLYSGLDKTGQMLDKLFPGFSAIEPGWTTHHYDVQRPVIFWNSSSYDYKGGCLGMKFKPILTEDFIYNGSRTNRAYGGFVLPVKE